MLDNCCTGNLILSYLQCQPFKWCSCYKAQLIWLKLIPGEFIYFVCSCSFAHFVHLLCVVNQSSSAPAVRLVQCVIMTTKVLATHTWVFLKPTNVFSLWLKKNPCTHRRIIISSTYNHTCGLPGNVRCVPNHTIWVRFLNIFTLEDSKTFVFGDVIMCLHVDKRPNCRVGQNVY